MDQTKIKACKSLMEMITVINQEYDLDAPLGPMAKGIVTTNLPKIVKMIGAKPRNNAVKR